MKDEIGKATRRLQRLVKAEWKRLQPEMTRCLKAGDYVGERELRRRGLERQDELVRQWQEWRMTKPPFTTEKDGILWRHPVTDGNRHLLNPRHGD